MISKGILCIFHAFRNGLSSVKMSDESINDADPDKRPLTIEPRPNYMYTPYSDITEQEDFAREFRRKIVLLYFVYMPLTLLFSSAIARWFFHNAVVSVILFFAAVALLALCLPYFTFFGMFTVGEFLKLHVAFYAWPIVPFMWGLTTVWVTKGNDAAFGIVLVTVSVLIMITNEMARRVSLATEEERLLQWPPLPGTDNETYLHC